MNRTYLGEVTKADQIRVLLAEGLGLKQIAAAVGCTTAYVRVVRNGRRKYDKKYQNKPEIRAARLITMRKRNIWRYHNDPTYRLGKAWRAERINRGIAP